jgi:hypothetical protein
MDIDDANDAIADALATPRRSKRPGESDPGPKEVAAKPEVDYEEVLIDLPPHAPDVRIDGRVFQHGMTYKVAAAQASSLRDVMFRAWGHEEEVRGQRTGFSPKPQRLTINGGAYR